MSIQKDDNNWPIVAICYDFDKTLSPQDMQNFDLIPKLQCSVEDFWNTSNNTAKQKGMDKILSYMKLIIDKAQSIPDIKIRRSDFKALGKTIKLFDGVETWFKRINRIAKKLEVKVEHYIISAGLKEIIQGTKIAKYFTGIYASEFFYDQYGKPSWPCQVVNYTSKTQYLFRINKNCLDLSDEDSVNEYIPDNDRRIPLRYFIYIGDSETDIPAMKVVKQGGGTSIGVYNPNSCNLDKVSKLLIQKRIDYLMPADYTENSRLENIVKIILEKIAIHFKLTGLNKSQIECVDQMEEIEAYIDNAKKYIDTYDWMETELKGLRKYDKAMVKNMSKNLLDKYTESIGEAEIKTYIQSKDAKLEEVFKGKTQKIAKKDGKKSKTYND